MIQTKPVLIAVGLGAVVASLVLGERVSLPPQYVLLPGLALAATLFAASTERRSRLVLRKYRERKCTGLLWLRRFPNAPAASIRQFLELVAGAFHLSGDHLKLAPDDRIIDIYRAIYPDRYMPDACELETLSRRSVTVMASI